MPKLRQACPSYRKHKASGQAIVRLSGRDVYLGPYGSPESRLRFDQFMAEWLANGRRAPAPKPKAPTVTEADAEAPLTINELIVRYMEFARGHYRKNGAPTREVSNIKDALRPLQKLYGSTPAQEFGPKRLKTLRERMIEDDLCRNVINRRVGKITRMFKWGASEELIPASVYHGLQCLQGLQLGRTAARESEPVKPVPEAFVEAICPFVSAQVWAMIELQRLTGMRPSEVLTIRTADLDTSGHVWSYRPVTHKTEHRGRQRVVFIGPRAQQILRPWLRPNLQEYLFQPKEADLARKAEMRAQRKTPVQPSQFDRSKPDAERKPGERYTTVSYRGAIARACRAADVPSWFPNQLRHNSATLLRKELGLDAAQAVLGHARADVTQVYAELDAARAADAMLRIG